MAMYEQPMPVVRDAPTLRSRLMLLFAGVLLPLIALGVLADVIVGHHNLPWDNAVLLWVHAHASPALDTLMILLAQLGYIYGVLPVDIVIVLLFIAFKRWGDALFFGIAVGGAQILDLLGKAFFHRVRPALWVSLTPEHSYSFPSGHAVASMALVAALSVLLWPSRWRWVALLLGGLFVLLVGLSRIYLGVHYPSDVLAGWAASLAWVVGVSMILYGRPAKPTAEAKPAA